MNREIRNLKKEDLLFCNREFGLKNVTDEAKIATLRLINGAIDIANEEELDIIERSYSEAFGAVAVTYNEESNEMWLCFTSFDKGKHYFYKDKYTDFYEVLKANIDRCPKDEDGFKRLWVYAKSARKYLTGLVTELEVAEEDLFNTLNSLEKKYPAGVTISNKWIRLQYYMFEDLGIDEADYGYLEADFDTYFEYISTWENFMKSYFKDNKTYSFRKASFLGPNPHYCIYNDETWLAGIVGNPVDVTEVLLEEFI